jgi:ABC-2 type transport system ATP-binding protein
MSSTAAEPVLLLEQVSVSRGRRRVLEPIDLGIAPGGVTAVFGRNGVGKSTLLQCLIGLLPIISGRLRVLGLDPWRDRAGLMCRVAFVPEIPDAPPHARVAQLLRFDAGIFPNFEVSATHRRLERAGIALGARAGELSRGQKTQLALALALARKPELLILDDPTLGLDPLARKVLIDELIGDLAERAPTIVLATHDLDLAERLADRLVVLAGGRITLDQPLDTLRAEIRRIVVPPGSEPPADVEIVAELGNDSLGRELLIRCLSPELVPLGARDAGLADIVAIHLELSVTETRR